jgi:IclR family pca regulon transcriptional regulator
LSNLCSTISNIESDPTRIPPEAVAHPAHSQSLERGLAILSAFGAGRSLIGVSELARELGLGRSTTHRYVATLARLGYLQQDESSRRYRLGLRVLDLGFSALNSMELRDIAEPHLQQLSDETGHTVNMAILDGAHIVYIVRCRSSSVAQREIDLNLHVGALLPAYCTSMGKVLLAHLPEGERRAALASTDFARRGPNTITTAATLEKELVHVRCSGFALNDEELAYGLRSIAMPIRTQTGEVAAAINLAAHRSMISIDDLIARLSPVLRYSADEISARLGYRGPA